MAAVGTGFCLTVPETDEAAPPAESGVLSLMDALTSSTRSCARALTSAL